MKKRLKQKQPLYFSLKNNFINILTLAEREGFEPPEQLPVHRISSAARSTTPASLLGVELVKMK